VKTSDIKHTAPKLKVSTARGAAERHGPRWNVSIIMRPKPVREP
jgi:hypothetical protein